MGSIEALTDAAIGRLRQMLSDRGEHALAIFVDPALGDPMNGDGIPAELVQPLHVRHPDMGNGTQPYVAWIDDERMHERVISNTIRYALSEVEVGQRNMRHPRSICSWLLPNREEPFKRSEIAWHLAQRAVLRRRTSKPMLFRFYDPRVMERLEAILRADQMSELLGPIGAWLYIDRKGHLRVIETAAVKTRTNASGSSPVDEKQWAAIARIDWIGRMLHLARGWGPAGVQITQDALDAELARAQAAGLSGSEDCIMFATCAFTLGRRFDHHPLIADILLQSVGAKGMFVRGISALDPNTLSDVAGMSRAPKSVNARSTHHA